MEGLMTYPLMSLHGTELAIDWDRLLASLMEHLPQVFEFILPRVTDNYECPFPSAVS